MLETSCYLLMSLYNRVSIHVVRSNLCFVFALLVLWLNTLGSNAHAEVSNDKRGQKLTFKINSQPLDRALILFGRQSGLQLSYRPELAEGKMSIIVEGKFTAKQAIDILLSGTEINAKFIDNSSVLLVKSSTRSLGIIEVQGLNPGDKNARGNVDDYIVLRSKAGSKSDTPIIEIPQAISVVNGAAIESRGAETISQSLRYSAGVHPVAQFDHSADIYSIRGIESLNGIFLDGTQHRVSRFDSMIEPYGIERIEVIRGPSSVLYGANSPAGLISAGSKLPLDKEHGDIGLSYGTYQRKQATADFGSSLSSDINYRAVVLLRGSKTQVDYVKDDRVYLAPSARWEPSEHTTITFLSYYQKDETDYAFGLPLAGSLNPGLRGRLDESTFLGEPGFNGDKREHYSFGYKLSHAFEEGLSFYQNARYFVSDVERNEMWDVINFGVQYDPGKTGILLRAPLMRKQRSISLTLDSMFLYQINSGSFQHKLVAGLDYRTTQFKNKVHTDREVLTNQSKYALDLYNPVYRLSRVDADLLYFSGDNEDVQLGGYLQDQIVFNNNTIFTLGGRYNRAKSRVVTGRINLERLAFENIPVEHLSGDDFTGRFGVTYLSEIGIAPYYNYSESFLPQSGGDGSSKPLKPETGRQHELGFKFQPLQSNSFVTLSLFDLVRENVVSRNGSGSVVNQIGKVHSLGIEFETAANLRNGLNATFAYSHVETRIKRSLFSYEIGSTPERIPEDAASAWLEYRFPISGISLGFGGRFVGRTYDRTNDISIPSFTVFDAFLGYRADKWSILLNSTNLFNRTYVAQCRSIVNEKLGMATATACSYGQKQQVDLTFSYHWGS